MKRKKQYGNFLLAALALACLGSVYSRGVAQENDGSLETVWDEHVKTLDGGEPDKNTSSEERSDGICSLPSFLRSEFVLGHTWPKLGPFKSDDAHPYTLVDSADNRLVLSVVGNDIMACQLDLSGATSENVLKLEMSTDFLLEALGLKPSKIHELNLGLEKDVTQLKEHNAHPFSFSSAPLLVVIDRQAQSTPGSAKSVSAFTIKVLNNATPVKEELTHTPSQPSLDAQENRTSSLGKTERIALSTERSPAIASKNSEKLDRTANTGKQSFLSKNGESNDLAATSPQKTSAENALGKSTQSKQDFLQIIQTWQGVKKQAVRQRDTSKLSQVLAGKALIRQIDAIKWLASNHKYYDMTPEGASVDHVLELVPGKKYSLSAQVKEKTKYIDEASGQVLKETNDTYNVTYTIEKVTGRWLITDSTLNKSVSASSTAKVHH